MIINKIYSSLKFTICSAFIVSLLLLTSCSKEDALPEEQGNIACFKKETSIYSDGEKTGTTKYIYNEHNLVEIELSYDLQLNLTDSTHHMYNSAGQAIRKYSYNFPYTYTQERTYSYNANGEEVSNELRENGELFNQSELFRGENGRVDSVHVTSQGIKTRHLYTYDQDTVRKIGEYDPSNNLIRVREYTYSGNETVIWNYDGNDKLITKTVLRYDEMGREISIQVYLKDNELSSEGQTEYDSHGNIVRKITNFIGFVMYVYETTWECP